MLPLLTWAYLRKYVAFHHHLESGAYQSVTAFTQLSGNAKHEYGFQHAATERDHQCRNDDASDIGGVRPGGSVHHSQQLSVGQGIKLPLEGGGTEIVNLNHRNANDSSTFIMRFSDNSSSLLITEQSAVIEVSGVAGVGISCGRVPALVCGDPGAASSGGVAGVVRPSGPTGAGDALSMSITPALSQVLLAPTSTSGTGAVISAAVAATKVGTANENVTSEEINSFYFYETEQFAVLWALFTVIVLGNSAVLVTMLLNKNRKSRMNFFIKQLAIADLCVGLLSVLTDIIWRMTVSWRAGNAACKAIRFAQASVTYASTYVLVALSIDRYDAITHPMNFSGCWNRARRLVAAAWSLSALFSLPIFYLYEERSIQGRKQCWIDLVEPWRWQVYMCWVATSLFVLPALIISACYAIIVKTIWAKGAILGPTDRTRNGMADLASRRASSRGIIPKAKVKTVKMTIVIVIVFVLCWSPYIVFDLLQVFEQIPQTQTNIAIASFIQSLAPLNSAANPLIYCLFSTQVCRMIKRLPPFRWLLDSKWCCKGANGGSRRPMRNGIILNGGPRLQNHNSSDSMRTLTTSLTVSQRSCIRPSRVVIVERPKVVVAMSEV
ncbi:cardioacceleratory peptide receptor [Malaya genurostris]|uniref:cardioacceleratory peptide receptor n=1 Tax=Malaya genurostris TaxID=325434 RepID=UPI0026F3B3A1|nr:cardioacceleratory peptide receptor [Malaya genurostris]XP_058453298.1 cardioacceleratory peptide receptor [Malaya genurostris]